MRDMVSVLVVEDDEMDVEVIRRLFKKQNITNPIYHAENGLRALEIMQGSNNKPRVPWPYIVLLDLNMPLMNGVEFLNRLRGDDGLKDSVVFVLTTSPREEDKEITYKLNVAGYFLKKDAGDLVHLLNQYWQLNEFPDHRAH